MALKRKSKENQMPIELGGVTYKVILLSKAMSGSVRLI